MGLLYMADEVRNQIQVAATLTHNTTGYTTEDLIAQALNVHNKLLAVGIDIDDIPAAADELVRLIAIGEIKVGLLNGGE